MKLLAMYCTVCISSTFAFSWSIPLVLEREFMLFCGPCLGNVDIDTKLNRLLLPLSHRKDSFQATIMIIC